MHQSKTQFIPRENGHNPIQYTGFPALPSETQTSTCVSHTTLNSIFKYVLFKTKCSHF